MSDSKEPQVESIEALIARLEADPTPRDDYHFSAPFRELRLKYEASRSAVPVGVLAEEIAFTIHAHDHQAPSIWGLYFGPMMSGVTKTGHPWESPALDLITPDVVERWRHRASISAHPVMRARYADLLWEMPRKLEHPSPDPYMARVAIDSYLEGVEGDRFEHPVTAIAKAERALDLALSLGDKGRGIRARDVLIALEDRVAEDDSAGLWGFSFDRLVAKPPRGLAISAEQRGKLVSDMEARLTRFAAVAPCRHHPAGAESAALRLAGYYRSQGRSDDVMRVMRVYVDIVRRMQGVAAPLVAGHTLERLYDQLKSLGLHGDADALNDLMRTTGEQTVSDMKSISVQASVPDEKIEAYFSAMLSGTAEQVLARIAAHFIPKKDDVEEMVRKLAKSAPLQYLLNHTIVDESGRPIARIGPLDEDIEGHIVRQMSQNMQLGAPWLREAFARGLKAGRLSLDAILTFVFGAAMFPERRRPVIQRGLEAFVQEDSVAALHILIPQVEQALRELAVLIQSPLYEQRRGGGLFVRTLDDLLRDAGIREVLGDDVVEYLRVLLTDQRGWNIRNDVSHGIASVSMLTMPVADRVVHAILVLSMFHKTDSDFGDTAGPAPAEP